MSETQIVLVGITSVLALGIGIQWLAWRVRLPSILLLLIAGLAVGPGLGLLQPDELLGPLLLPIVSLSIGLILFEGALGLKMRELREVGGAVIGLVSVGALFTWVLAAGAAYWLLGAGFSEAVLLGAILVVTGPTVIGPLLQQVRPTGPVGKVAKWEGIVIDPIGAILAVLVFEAFHDAEAVGTYAVAHEAAVNLLRTIGIGFATSLIAGGLMYVALRRYWIPDFLQSPVLLMVVVLTVTVSNLLQHESGLLAVTVLGILLANQKSVPIEHLVEFKENLRVVLISGLFIILAARIPVSSLESLHGQSIAFLAFLILVVRPLSVFLSTIHSGLTWKDKVFLAWMAPRGIVAASVASVFALQSGGSGSLLVPITFLVIVVTVSIYGLTIGPLARTLGLATANPQGLVMAGSNSLARALASVLQNSGFKVLLVDSNPTNISTARMEGLPTCYGSILSERVWEQMDLGGMGYFLALTPNDEINSLAAMHFSDLFDRAGVYQLAPPKPRTPRAETTLENQRGRLLFSSEATYGFLQSQLAQGAVVKKTNLTEEFDYESLRTHYDGQVLPLFVISESKKLTICTVTDPIKPKPNDTLVFLAQPVDETPESKPAESKSA